MSSDAFILQGTIDVDINDAVNSLNRVDRQVDSSGSSMSGVFGKLGKAIAGAFAVSKIVDFGTKCLSAASEVEEMENKFNVVFKNTSKTMDEWADSYADAIGRSKTEIKTAISNQADLMIGMGMTEEVAGDLSQKYTELAYDLASFNNVQDSTALEAMTKAMFGETEMAKQLGLNLSATTMENSEYVKSLGKKWSAMTQAEKAEAYYQEALKQSVNAIGDAERSAGSYANQIRRTQSKVTEFTETLGTYMLPMATNVVTGFGNMIDGAIDFVNSVAGGFGKAREEFEATGEYVDALDVFLQEVFGISMPNTFFYMVESIIAFFQELWSVVIDIWNTVGVPLFDIIIQVWDNLKENSGIIFGAISTAFDVMTNIIKTIYETILKPVFEFFIDLIKTAKQYFEENCTGMGGIFTEFVDMIKALWEGVLKPVIQMIGDFLTDFLLPTFKIVFVDGILPAVKVVFDGIGKLWHNSLKPIFQGIIDFVQGVFAGDWSRAWNGIVQAFGGIMSGLGTVIKAPLNAVIALVNGAISALNSISVDIPSWVPIVGGQSFGVNIPSIAYLENGGILTQPTMLNSNVMAGERNKGKQGQAEAVIPLDRLEGWIKELATRPVKVAINGHEFIEATVDDFSEALAFQIQRKMAY